ncbi:MAG TPA: hypothetical protein VM143_17265 [Acidimicrobiales bacterium]|nr:hypothetical protein [Acidimicrobiales bacterium]
MKALLAGRQRAISPQAVPAGRVLDPSVAGASSLLRLQRDAGNKAVTAAIQATKTKAPTKTKPGPKKPRSLIDDMPYSEVEAQLAHIRMQLAQQTDQSSKLADFMRLRIGSLERRKAAIAKEETALTTSTGRGKRSGATQAKLRGRKDVPASLTMPAGFLALMPGFDAGKEIDAIHAYLRAGATKAERARLGEALRTLKGSSDAEVAAKVSAERRAKVDRRLQSLYGDETQQLEQLAGIMDSIQRDPNDPGLMWLPNGSERIPVGVDEVQQLRAKVNATLDDAARKVHASFQKAWEAWEARNSTNQRHSNVHKAVKWYTGTADITEAEMDQNWATSKGLRDLVTSKATAGQYAKAVHFLLVGQGHAVAMANRIEAWEGSLVAGAGWLVVCLTVLKEGLTLLATAGAAGIVRSGAAGALSVLGASTAAGGVAAGGASVVDQVSSGEGVSLRKTVGAVRVGAAEGMAIGGGAAADKAFKVAGATSKAGAAIRSIGAGTALDVASAAAKGDSVKGAAVGSIAGGTVGHTLKAAAKGRKAGEVAADVVAGGAKAAAAGGDAKDVAKGAVLGGAGNVVGGAVTNHRAHDPSSTGGTGESGGSSTTGDAAELLLGPAGKPAGGGADAPTTTSHPGEGATTQAPPNVDIPEAHAPTVPGGNHGEGAHVPTVPPAPHADPRSTVGSGEGATPHPDPVNTVASGDGPAPGSAPRQDGAGAGGAATHDAAGPDTRFDNIDLPSVPMGVEHLRFDRARFREVEGLAGEGVSGQRRLEDTTTGQQYLFKPANEAIAVPRAKEHGIRTGEHHSRADAAAHVANQLGIDTPEVRSVVIGNEKGSLTRWEGGTISLKKLRDKDPDAFRRVVSSSEYRRQRNAIDALDYLTNNVDRGQNLGNLLVQLDTHGELVRLIPVDHDLTFTSTIEHAVIENFTRPLPPEYSPEMRANLERLSADRAKLIEVLTPLVGERAIPGVLHRLDELVVDAKRKAIAAERRGVAAAH